MSELHDRLQRIFYPFIIPVDDKFSYQIHKKTKRTFSTVTCAVYKDVSEIIAWLENETKQSWLIPTITVAGEEWKINPKYNEFGWTWLFVKG